MKPETLVALFVGALISLVADSIRRHVFRPRLEVCFDPSNPVDGHITRVFTQDTRDGRILEEFDAFYFRVRVCNSGSETAKGVQVTLQEVSTATSTGAFIVRAEHLPLNLRWSHLGTTTYPAIPVGIERHCDVLRWRQSPVEPLMPTDDPRRDIEGAEPQTEVGLPGGRLWLPPGRHRLVLLVAADNAEARMSEVYLQVPQRWDSNAQRVIAGMGVSGLAAKSSRFEMLGGYS